MADAKTKDDRLLGETVPANEADSLRDWTAQSDNRPAPNAREMPQQFVDEQLPDADEMDKTGLEIPENQKAGGSVEFLDPADQVRVGNPDYASPLGVTANPEGAHIPGESAPPENIVAAPEKDNEAKSGTPDDTWTKDEIKAYADEQGIDGVNMSMSKADMLAAVG